MMKINYLLFPFLMIVAGCSHPQDPNRFELRGTIKGISEKQAILNREIEGWYTPTDTVALDANGQFVFTGSIDVPELVRLKFNDTLMIPLFLERGVISVEADEGNLRGVVIRGSPANDAFRAYNDTVEKLFGAASDSLFARYMQARAARDEALVNRIAESLDELEQKELEFRKQYIGSRTNSIIAPYVLWRELSYDMEADELEPLLNRLDTSLNASLYVKNLRERLEVLKKVAVGQPAPDFTLNDPTGKPVSLSSKFGKYLLVDFWASWCGPCRRENPNVVKAYKLFNKKGFDVMGISLDCDSASWVKAIRDDQLTWTHVSDLKYWNSEAARLYGIRSIPSNLLLDPKGIIIAKNLRGEALQNKLSELLK